MKAYKISALIFIIMLSIGHCDLTSELESLIGYTIVSSKTISGWFGEDEEGGTAFKGCKRGRTIKFTDGTYLRCAEYGYQYAYRPTAILLAKEIPIDGKSYFDIKMIVESEVYDMRK